MERPRTLVPRPLGALQLRAQVDQDLVRVAGAHLGERVEERHVGWYAKFGSLGAGRAHAAQKSRDAIVACHALAIVAGQDEELEVVAHVMHVIGLELLPIGVPRARRVRRVERLEHHALIALGHGAIEPVHDLDRVVLGGWLALRVGLHYDLLGQLHRVSLPSHIRSKELAPLAHREGRDALPVEPDDVEDDVARLVAGPLQVALVVAREAPVLAKGRVVARGLIPHHHLAVQNALAQVGREALGEHRSERLAV